MGKPAVMNDTLPSRILGSTGLEVSTLGLGTVKFGRNSGVKYPNQFDLPDDEQIRQLLCLLYTSDAADE